MKVLTELTEFPGTVCQSQISQTLQAGVRMYNTRNPSTAVVAGAYRTYTGFGCGYESRTELTEAPGTGINVVQNSQNFRYG